MVQARSNRVGVWFSFTVLGQARWGGERRGRRREEEELEGSLDCIPGPRPVWSSVLHQRPLSSPAHQPPVKPTRAAFRPPGVPSPCWGPPSPAEGKGDAARGGKHASESHIIEHRSPGTQASPGLLRVSAPRPCSPVRVCGRGKGRRPRWPRLGASPVGALGVSSLSELWSLEAPAGSLFLRVRRPGLPWWG